MTTTCSKRLLVFEGLPGSGKTTLANEISSRLNIAVATRRHLSENTSDYLDYNLEFIKSLTETMILDRFIWSDVVFSTLRGINSLESFYKTKRVLEENGVQYTLYYVVSPVSRQTHSSFSEQELGCMRNEYERLLKEEHDVMILDYSKLSLEEAVCMICRSFEVE